MRVSILKRGLYLRFSTGLFEKHKLLFSFNMTIKIEQAEGRVPQDELDFFLKGNGACWLAPSSYPRAPRHVCPFTIKVTSSEIPFKLGLQELKVI